MKNSKKDKKIITENLRIIILVKIHSNNCIIRPLGPLRLTVNGYVTLFQGLKWPVYEASKLPSSKAQVANFPLQVPRKQGLTS
jgi:hypothetical protein